MTVRSLVLSLALAGWPSACSGPRSDTPVDAYLGFATAVRKGEPTAAYGALSAGTQQVLQQRADAISKASGGAVKADAAALFFSSGQRPSPVAEVKAVREEGDRAVVRVTADGQTREIALIKEPTGWKLDLAEAL